MTATPNDTASVPASPWLTKVEAAVYAKMTVRTLDRAIADGKLRISGGGSVGAPSVRIHIDWLDEWLANR